MTARRRRRISLIVQAIILVAVLVAVIMFTNWERLAGSFFKFDRIHEMFPRIITVGLLNTLLYTALSFIVGLAGGMLLALMKLSTFTPYRWIATAYIELFRGLPALLVLAAVAFGFPLATGVNLPALAYVVIGLGLVSSAYIAETLRAGLQAVPPGQMEAARSLGMPTWRAMVSIVVPQAFRIVLPPLTNELILLTKDSSLAFVVGFTLTQLDLTALGREGVNTLGSGITPLVVAGLFYLVITIPLSVLARALEKRGSSSSGRRTRKPTEEVSA